MSDSEGKKYIIEQKDRLEVSEANGYIYIEQTTNMLETSTITLDYEDAPKLISFLEQIMAEAT